MKAQLESAAGFYGVKIVKDSGTQVHTVYAPSDYAAAVIVRRATGCMAKSESDVFFVSATLPYDSGTMFMPARPA